MLAGSVAARIPWLGRPKSPRHPVSAIAVRTYRFKASSRGKLTFFHANLHEDLVGTDESYGARRQAFAVLSLPTNQVGCHGTRAVAKARPHKCSQIGNLLIR